jgi:hypothetical protein
MILTWLTDVPSLDGLTIQQFSKMPNAKRECLAFYKLKQ